MHLLTEVEKYLRISKVPAARFGREVMHDLQLGLGGFQQRMGQVDKAVATYRAILERDDETPAALTALSWQR